MSIVNDKENQVLGTRFRVMAFTLAQRPRGEWHILGSVARFGDVPNPWQIA